MGVCALRICFFYEDKQIAGAVGKDNEKKNA